MFTKTKMAVSAAIVLGAVVSASAASRSHVTFAHRAGDR